VVRIDIFEKTADDLMILNIVALKGEAVKTEEAERTGGKKENNFSFFLFDRLAPRKPRPSGRGQGELYKNIYLPYREAPPFRAGRLHLNLY